MYGFNDLKERILITNDKVECPVKGCNTTVERKRKKDRLELEQERFKCPVHNIYISPTTWAYSDKLDNLLWKDKADIELLGKLKTAKRENRMSHDNSEDAVTWNVFRFLEKNNLIESIFLPIVDNALTPSKFTEIIYWSYSQTEGAGWTKLLKARGEFGEGKKTGSEPDVIIKTDKALLFIEAKVTANNAPPPPKNINEKYITGGNKWFEKVFKSDYPSLVKKEKKYELMRFWLLGTWIAYQLNLDFYLVNITLKDREQDIEDAFKKHIKHNEHRKFKRITWENIYHKIARSEFTGPDKDTLMNYFRAKTIGYSQKQELQRAFSIED